MQFEKNLLKKEGYINYIAILQKAADCLNVAKPWSSISSTDLFSSVTIENIKW